MASLNSESLRAAAEPEGNINPEDRRTIVFRDGAKIGGRKPGVPYVVDSALADHYCRVLGCADEVAPEASEEPEEPGEVTDRGMTSPPKDRALRRRGGRG